MGTPQLNIKDAEVTAMVRELADLMGETQTEAVRQAVKRRLAEERTVRDRSAARAEDAEVADLRAFLARAREEMKPHPPSGNDTMYDEFGAPI